MLQRLNSFAILPGLLFLALLYSGCATLSSFQEARTLEKGKGRMHVAATDYSALVRESSGFPT